MKPEQLLTVLKQSRYKILVAIRPLASAKLGFDMVVAELVATLRQGDCDIDIINQIEGLKFND